MAKNKLNAVKTLAWYVCASLVVAVFLCAGCRDYTRNGGCASVTRSQTQTTWKETSVRSSVFSKLAYDARRQTARAYFKNGAIYDYYDVPPHVYAGWIRASSKGKYFHAHIRGYYRYAKIDL